MVKRKKERKMVKEGKKNKWNILERRKERREG